MIARIRYRRGLVQPLESPRDPPTWESPNLPAFFLEKDLKRTVPTPILPGRIDQQFFVPRFCCTERRATPLPNKLNRYLVCRQASLAQPRLTEICLLQLRDVTDLLLTSQRGPIRTQGHFSFRRGRLPHRFVDRHRSSSLALWKFRLLEPSSQFGEGSFKYSLWLFGVAHAHSRRKRPSVCEKARPTTRLLE